jgi:hypothetical protein
MRKILILISFATLILSCEKEKIVEIEKEYNWKKHVDFQYNDVVQMNSFASNERLFFYGQNSFTSLVADSLAHPDLPFGGNVSHYSVWNEQPANRKLPICSDYSISSDKNNGTIYFFSTMNPVLSESSTLIHLKTIDTTYAYFDFLHFSSGECIAINDQNKSLIPYISFVDSKNVLKLALIDIKTEFMISYYYLDTLEVNILTISDENQYDVIALESVGDYFFLTTNSKVYRIDNNGNIENVLSTRLNKIVESSGKIYGFGRDNIYFSSDNGLSWQMGYNVQYDYSLLNYSKIGDKIIGYRYGQLWELQINDTELIVQELDNDGLEGISITSVSSFDKKVYLSTLSGVYYKSIDEFFNYKTEKTE